MQASFLALLVSAVVGIEDPENGDFCPPAVLGQPGAFDGIVAGKCAEAGVCRYTPLSCIGSPGIVYGDTCTCPPESSRETYFCEDTTPADSRCTELDGADESDRDFRNDAMCPLALPSLGAPCFFADDVTCRYSPACPDLDDPREFTNICKCEFGTIFCQPESIPCLELEITTCPIGLKPPEDQRCKFRADLHCLYDASVCQELANPVNSDIAVEFNCTCTERNNGESRLTCEELPYSCTGLASNTTCPSASNVALAGRNSQCDGVCRYDAAVCPFPGSNPAFTTICECLPGPDFGLICAQALLFCEDPFVPPGCPEGTFSIGGGTCICFSGASTVETLERGSILMQDLEIGDAVLTAGNKYERVYSFGHYKRTGSSKYLTFNQGLQISHSHMLAVLGRGYVPASTVHVGEELIAADGTAVLVKSIHITIGTGMFAPFTASGTIIVNGIVASTFVSMQSDSAELEVAGVSTGLTWQWLARTFEVPHRLLVGSTGDVYDENGLSTWVAKPLELARWLQRQNDVVAILVWVPILMLVVCFALIDVALLPLSLVAAFVGGAMLQHLLPMSLVSAILVGAVLQHLLPVSLVATILVGAMLQHRIVKKSKTL